MKSILLALICLLTVQLAKAQKSLLELDEHNKYIYYQVVDRQGVNKDSLNGQAAAFIKYAFSKLKPKAAADSSIAVNDKFLTYNTVLLARHESGEIRYTLTIECKNAKYRYWLTDFVFVPYERNRYDIYVPVSGIEIPLEKAAPKLDKKELEGYFDQTGLYCQQLGEKLKLYMSQDHSPNKQQARPEPVKKVVTKNW